MAMRTPLHKVTDAAQWDAEDLFGRLCIVAHAAFLYAGFLPCDAPDTTPSSPSRRYSLPQLVHREGADGVVLCLSRSGRRRGGRGGGQVTLVSYVSSDDDGRQRSPRRVRLTSATLVAVLSLGVDDAARALRSPDAADGAWLWKLLADGLCRDLFLDLCRGNGVPVEPSFMSLPADMKVHVLRRLDDAEDVARVECASKEVRRLVAEHDAELWEAKCEAIQQCSPTTKHGRPSMPMFLFLSDSKTALMSWKQRYVVARRRSSALAAWRESPVVPVPRTAPRVPHRRTPNPPPIPWSIVRTVCENMKRTRIGSPWDQPEAPAQEIAEQMTRESAPASEQGWKAAQNRNRRQSTTAVWRRWCRKAGHGAGAVHSPSSQYRWRHR